jgi:hypothetical protein
VCPESFCPQSPVFEISPHAFGQSEAFRVSFSSAFYSVACGLAHILIGAAPVTPEWGSADQHL